MKQIAFTVIGIVLAGAFLNAARTGTFGVTVARAARYAGDGYDPNLG
jgi:hypothetical protein